MTASMGLPDLGIITTDEVAFFIRQVARASGLPVLVDGDTGYGEALNVMNMVRAFEDAGAAAVQYRGSAASEEMRPSQRQETGRCARHGRQGRRRRESAAAPLSHRKNRRRGQRRHGRRGRSCEALSGSGADAIFPEAMISRDMFQEFARRVPGVPLLANMTEFGRTPFFTAAEFEAMGYRMVIWPVSSPASPTRRSNICSPLSNVMAAPIKWLIRCQTRAELYATIGLHNYEALDASIIRTIIPEGIPQR